MGDEVVGAEASWVGTRGNNPEGQINAKTQTRQEVTITMNGDSDGYGQHYGLWWSSQLVPVKARKFYWGNYGNSGSSGWIFMRVKGYYAKGIENPVRWKKFLKTWSNPRLPTKEKVQWKFPGYQRRLNSHLLTCS